MNMLPEALTAPAAPPSREGAVDAVDVVESTPAEWRAYLLRHGRGDLYHDDRWDRIFELYGLRCVRLVVRRAGRPVGVLPLVAMRSWIFGNRLVSLPWFDAAGALSDDAAAHQALVERALELTDRARAPQLQLRQPAAVDGWKVERNDKVLMRLALERDPEVLWKGFDAKVRNQVRKAEKSGLIAETGAAELVPDFCRVYSQNMRDLGSPSHSQTFFETVVRVFPEAAKIHVVRLEGAVIGAGLTLANGRTLDIPWASSLAEYNRLCVNHALYWHILRQACGDGYEWFNFGRSSVGSGQHHFKKQWGAEEVPLFWYALDRGGNCQVDARPPQESFGMAVRVWQKLPLWLTRRLGPRFIRQVP